MTAAAVTVPLALAQSPASAEPPGGPGTTAATAPLPKVAVMTGAGGAVASVDRDASQIGIDVLRRGGTAADAAVATAAALGVTEPYSAGIGGGGFFVYYEAKSGTVSTIDGRETAPQTFTETTFINPDGSPMNFANTVSSGLSIGTPGTPMTWEVAARTWGKRSLSDLLAPAQQLAERGFVVDQTFHDQTAANAARFAKFPETARVYLPGGAPPAVGSTFRNPDMAKAYALLRAEGVDALYDGALGEAIVAEAQNPTTAPGVTVPLGQLTMEDLRAYTAPIKDPVHSQYRDLDVYGMPTPSSGGIAVAEILNLLEAYDERTGVALKDVSNTEYLHRFSEASATAFADRNRYVGDVPGVPTEELVSQAYADERACLFSETTAMTRPVPFGEPDGSYGGCADAGARQPVPQEGQSTTHLTAADKWGNVAAYTLTIEQTGGSGITVPGYGLILNNELTDFNFAPGTANSVEGGKRPRSSMSPSIVYGPDGTFRLAVGAAGGSTIIAQVAKALIAVIDWDMSAQDAIDLPVIYAPGDTVFVEEGTVLVAMIPALQALGHAKVMTRPGTYKANAVELVDGEYVGAADRRSEGMAVSQ